MTRAAVQSLNAQIRRVEDNARKKLRTLQDQVKKGKVRLGTADKAAKPRILKVLQSLRRSIRDLRTDRDGRLVTLRKRKAGLQEHASFSEGNEMNKMNKVVARLVEVAAGRSQEWFDNLKPVQQRQYLKENPNSKFGKAKPGAKKAAPSSPTKPSKKGTEVRKAGRSPVKAPGRRSPK